MPLRGFGARFFEESHFKQFAFLPKSVSTLIQPELNMGGGNGCLTPFRPKNEKTNSFLGLEG
jgi:hypothetical protein